MPGVMTGVIAPTPEATHPEVAAPVLTPPQRERLISLARTSLAAATGLLPRSAVASAMRSAPTGLHAAAFVTLFEDGELRACMGLVDPGSSVERAVVDAARMAALDDPRFLPVRAEELRRIELEVSVLGPSTRLPDPAAFVAGEDGIIVARDGRRAYLLPQVATEHGLDAEGMLSTACRKAGLRADAWRDPATALFVFRVTRFGGPALPETRPLSPTRAPLG